MARYKHTTGGVSGVIGPKDTLNTGSMKRVRTAIAVPVSSSASSSASAENGGRHGGKRIPSMIGGGIPSTKTERVMVAGQYRPKALVLSKSKSLI